MLFLPLHQTPEVLTKSFLDFSTEDEYCRPVREAMNSPINLPNDLLRRWCAPVEQTGPIPRSMIIVAHPDDEVIGLGAQLPRLRGNVTMVHVTDGAPRDGQDAQMNGFANLEDYMRARREELDAALALAGIIPAQTRELNFVDKSVREHIVELTCRLRDLFEEERPELAVTHPYEGGHPDHDVTAFAARAACDLMVRDGHPPPALIEMASYHGDENNHIRSGLFLPAPETPEEVVLKLSWSRRWFKRRLFNCFPTQAWILANFPIGIERFRPAPRYDFTLPPQNGGALYENYDWGMTALQTVELMRVSARTLGLSPSFLKS